MRTIFSCRRLVVLVCAHLCWKLSKCAVFPCSKNDTQFGNRTLDAGIGGTVSFKFCAENSVRVFERITISHPNHRHGWYPPQMDVEERLQVKVIIHHHEARVNVRVTKLQPADFNETFSVTLFAADENGTRINDSSTFFFVIKETGHATTVLTTPSTPLTTAAEIKTEFLPDLRHTTTGCDEQSDGRPRLAMCRVIDDICMMVFEGNINLTPKAQCAAENASHIADFNSIDILKPCLTGLLLYNPVTIVRLDEIRYIEIQNWAEVRPRWPYLVACLLARQQLADPVITWFTLQRWDDQRETIIWEDNLLDGNNTSVVIPATNVTLNVTCQASGYPKPKIVILRDNEAIEVLPDGISLQLSHTFYGELMCQATNVLTSRQTHIRVLVSATGENVIGKESLNKRGDLFDHTIHSVVLVLEFVLCSLLVVILLVIAFLCLRKKATREHTRDVIQGQEEIPMVATQTGSNTRHNEYSSC